MTEAKEPPSIVILAGPNGAGKTTAASFLLPEIGVTAFVNADVIAAELSPGAPEQAAFEAGRRALARLETLVGARDSFALETTLAGRAYAPWLRRCLAAGYDVHLRFL